MKKLWQKKEYLAIFIVIILFISVSLTSISSIRFLQGNARVVNYVGIVRGATQKLIKEEIMGWHMMQTDESFIETSDWYPDDALVARLDSIVDELLTGVGPNGLVVLHDETYLSNVRMIQVHWAQLKELIAQVRAGEKPDMLFESSQEYFELVNKTVFSAETYSENQVSRTNNILIFVNGAFILLIVIGLLMYLRGLSVKRQADALGKIAYIDSLTQLNNRASCERLISKYSESPEDREIAVFMFDMNDLKLTNDFLGHKGGDKIIVAFGNVLQKAADGYCYIGRYGGDEFFAISDNGDESTAKIFLEKVRDQVNEYNKCRVNKLEKIQYASGYVIANPKAQHIDDIIHEADKRMYLDKRRAKGLV